MRSQQPHYCVQGWPIASGANPCLLLLASLQAQVVLSFQAYPTARCVLLEVQVPAARVRPGQSVVCEIPLRHEVYASLSHALSL